MKAEDVCRKENEGKDYRCCCAICVLKPVGERYLAVVDHVETLVWKADGSPVPVERLSNWELDEPEPPQPKQRIEEWEVVNDPFDGLQLANGRSFNGGPGLDYCLRDPRWSGTYIFHLPDGRKEECGMPRLWWHKRDQVWGSPHGRLDPEIYDLLHPAAVPMLVEEKP